MIKSGPRPNLENEECRNVLGTQHSLGPLDRQSSWSK